MHLNTTTQSDASTTSALFEGACIHSFNRSPSISTILPQDNNDHGLYLVDCSAGACLPTLVGARPGFSMLTPGPRSHCSVSVLSFYTLALRLRTTFMLCTQVWHLRTHAQFRYRALGFMLTLECRITQCWASQCRLISFVSLLPQDGAVVVQCIT